MTLRRVGCAARHPLAARKVPGNAPGQVATRCCVVSLNMEDCTAINSCNIKLLNIPLSRRRSPAEIAFTSSAAVSGSTPSFTKSLSIHFSGRYRPSGRARGKMGSSLRWLVGNFRLDIVQACSPVAVSLYAHRRNHNFLRS